MKRFIYKIWRRWFPLKNIGWQFYICSSHMAHLEYTLYRDLDIEHPIMYKELYDELEPLRELKEIG